VRGVAGLVDLADEIALRSSVRARAITEFFRSRGPVRAVENAVDDGRGALLEFEVMRSMRSSAFMDAVGEIDEFSCTWPS